MVSVFYLLLMALDFRRSDLAGGCPRDLSFGETEMRMCVAPQLTPIME